MSGVVKHLVTQLLRASSRVRRLIDSNCLSNNNVYNRIVVISRVQILREESLRLPLSLFKFWYSRFSGENHVLILMTPHLRHKPSSGAEYATGQISIQPVFCFLGCACARKRVWLK